MKSLPFPLFFLLLLTVSLLSSCEVQDVELVDLKKVEVNKVEKSEMYLDVIAELDNPNSFNIKITDSDLDLYLEGNFIGKASLMEAFTLKKNSVNEYPLSIRASGKNLNLALLPIFLSAALTGKVKVGLKGDITGKVFFISKSVPIDIEEEVKFKKDKN